MCDGSQVWDGGQVNVPSDLFWSSSVTNVTGDGEALEYANARGHGQKARSYTKEGF